jgi:hypothetical protein
MPLASSTDLVMAGIQDIIQALQNPTANSPLAPCTDSQVQALQDLTSLLTGIIKQDSHDAPSLRVDAPATWNETTTKQSNSIKTSAYKLAPALRVEFKEPLTEPTVPPHQVQADEPATYENSTGAKGRCRRKQACKPRPLAQTQCSSYQSRTCSKAAVQPTFKLSALIDRKKWTHGEFDSPLVGIKLITLALSPPRQQILPQPRSYSIVFCLHQMHNT